MRLIRSVLRPAKSHMSLQFQRCQEETSSAHLRPVLIETSNLVHESNVQCRGRSSAASAPSETLEPRKERRRVTKDERKSMVEIFVNKYRKMNAGKFPTISDAQKVVGGSYYVVREILQELKYNSVMSSMDAKDTPSLEKSAAKEDKISRSFESKEGPRSSVSVESDKSKDVGTHSHSPSDEPKRSLRSDPKNNIKQENIHQNKLKFDGLHHKAEQQESTETEISGRELHEVPTEDAEPQRKSSVWQNLKSFANEILGLWKR